MKTKTITLLTLGGLIVLLVTMALAPPAMAATYDANMVTYWNFDEASGFTAIDSAGNDNTGILANYPTRTSGKYNGALYFDGINGGNNNTGDNRYVYASNITGLNTGNNFTVSLWSKPAAQTITRMVQLGDLSGTWVINTHGTKYAFGIYNGSSWNFVETNTAYPINAWTNLTVTYDSDKKVSLYYNGTLDASATFSHNMPTVDFAVSIGSDLATSFGDYPHKGTMDDIGIWNTAKSGADVYSVYVNGIHPIDIPSRAAEINSYLTGSGLTLTQTELETMANAAINDPGGTKTLISGNLYHYEPVLMGAGVSGNPYYYDFSLFTDLNAQSWIWGTGVFSAFSSLNDWYLKVPTGTLLTADGNAIVAPGEDWILKTGGANGTGGSGDVPEIPAGLLIPLLGILGTGLIFIRKKFFVNSNDNK